jgi:hypothetical protein
MLVAVATGCADHDTCWRPVQTPDRFPFPSLEFGAVWAGLLILCLAVLVARLVRG